MVTLLCCLVVKDLSLSTAVFLGVKRVSLLLLVYQNLSWRIQSGGQPNVSESTKVHIVVPSSYVILLKTDLRWSAGLQLSANTEKSDEADKNLFRLTPYGALPDWWVYPGLICNRFGVKEWIKCITRSKKTVGKQPVHHMTHTDSLTIIHLHTSGQFNKVLRQPELHVLGKLKSGVHSQNMNTGRPRGRNQT